ncbi:response regulator transcription factor [Shewanella canadensis]|uniref:Response regulator transcription factor n=1 Tax=Shewanella canadensis TaxID=271096 RepID=A0A3S0LL63_9GAMM|nr:response regulator transcription factor [Shewanella canadensis]RTR38046.1 response regulator transcription factor [Shewanella canadensis]
MPHILLVEDDEKIARLLVRLLSFEGFDVNHANNGDDAITIIGSLNPDLVILDMMLPGKDGFEVCDAVRSSFKNSILMLTAHEGDLNEVSAFKAGVDDFVIKPVKPDILLARINALLRRQTRGRGTHIQVADLDINPDSRKVIINSQAIDITDSEFQLLWILASNVGQVISREALFQQIMDKDFDGLDRSIDMRISKLRKKLKQHSPNKEYIRTLRQAGYLFIDTDAQ